MFIPLLSMSIAVTWLYDSSNVLIQLMVPDFEKLKAIGLGVPVPDTRLLSELKPPIADIPS